MSKPRPIEKWRYNIVSIENEKSPQAYNDMPLMRSFLLEYCGNLTKPPIELGIWWDAGGGGHDASKMSAFWQRDGGFGPDPETIPTTEVELLKEVWNLAQQIKPDSLIFRALISFDEARILPFGSDAETLKYFGIVESLLTHKPQPHDTIDSITRQIRTKFNLLQPFFARKIDSTAYFEPSVGADILKLWSKLYAYRSTVAHGDKVDFSSDFRVFKNVAAVAAYL